ncbi:MAG: STAS domain-containing protein [Myxococcales bacterium]
MGPNSPTVRIHQAPVITCQGVTQHMEFKKTICGTTTTVEISGELDATTVAELRPQLNAIADELPSRVEVDLSRLRLVDSSGVGAIIALFKRVRANGNAFVVTGVNGQPLSIFKVLRLDKVFDIE